MKEATRPQQPGENVGVPEVHDGKQPEDGQPSGEPIAELGDGDEGEQRQSGAHAGEPSTQPGRIRLRRSCAEPLQLHSRPERPVPEPPFSVHVGPVVALFEGSGDLEGQVEHDGTHQQPQRRRGPEATRTHHADGRQHDRSWKPDEWTGLSRSLV